MINNYVPEQGDIIKLDFNPVRGHEQGGYRPAIVITKKSYNQYSNVILVCPITSKFKGHAYEISLDNEDDKEHVYGSVLTNHVKSIDYGDRKITYLGKAKESIVWEVLAMVRSLIE
jgi:mRNA interferase MazF